MVISPPEIEREERLVRLHLEGARLHIQVQGGKLAPGGGGTQRCLDRGEGVLDDALHLGAHLIAAVLRLNAEGNAKGAALRKIAEFLVPILEP